MGCYVASQFSMVPVLSLSCWPVGNAAEVTDVKFVNVNKNR